MYLNKQYVSWEEITYHCKNFAQQKQYNTIVAIGTGGLIPATILSKQMKEARVYNLGIKTRQEHTTGEPIIYQKPPHIPPPEGRILLVDDVFDSGKTINEAKKVLQSIWSHDILPHLDVYCVFAAEWAKDLRLTLFSNILPKDTWLIFPWE